MKALGLIWIFILGIIGAVYITSQVTAPKTVTKAATTVVKTATLTDTFTTPTRTVTKTETQDTPTVVQTVTVKQKDVAPLGTHKDSYSHYHTNAKAGGVYISGTDAKIMHLPVTEGLDNGKYRVGTLWCIYKDGNASCDWPTFNATATVLTAEEYAAQESKK